MDLYIQQQGRQLGPYSLSTVREMLRQGNFSSKDLIWHEGAPDWVTLSAFMAARNSSPSDEPAPPPIPAQIHEDSMLRLEGIGGLDGMTASDLHSELQRGGRFVIYQYCISVLVMTFKRSSGIYFVKSGESAFSRGAGYSVISFFCGWWGIPWGPIWTITTIVTNCGGGKDVTPSIVGALNKRR
ncbi:MAG: hypothetical protein JWR26_2494 [Pedosphaera sp.]|nr:hypothetical protein [Pedosphaera sp.]